MPAPGSPPLKRRVTPYAQGDLDSMCGVYAIINALRAVCREITEKISVRLLRYLVRSLSKYRKQALFPVILGTNASLMRKLLGEAQAYLKKRLKIEVVIEPKGRELKSRSLEAAWDRFASIVDEATVLILPLGGRCSHWTALYDATKNPINRFEPSSRADALAVHARSCKKALSPRAFGRNRDQPLASFLSCMNSRTAR